MKVRGVPSRSQQAEPTNHPASAAGSGRRWFRAGAGPGRFCLVFLLLGAGALAARAADRAKPGKGDKPAPAEGTPKGGEKRFAFSFDNKPWTQVLEWFADNAKLAFVGNYKPAGTFTFVPPKVNGQLKTYTLAEIVDILNEALVVNSSTKRYVLVRRSQSFTLVLADDKIPRDMIPTVDVADLPSRGRTEIVRINVVLEGADAEETAPKIKKMMTQLGDAVAFDPGNHLVLIDTVASLTEVMKTIQVIGSGNKDNSPRYVHQCRFIKAREGERVLRELFGLPPVLPPEMAAFVHRVSLERAMNGQPPGGQARPPAPKVRPIAVVAAEDSNTIIVTGPPDKVAEAKQTLIDLEEKSKAGGAKEQPIGPPMVKRYTVQGGEAQPLAQMLQEKYRLTASVRVVSLGPNELMVSAPVADQFDIAALISEGVSTQKVKVIPLKTDDGYSMEDTLRGMFGDRYKSPRAAYIEARTRTSITVQGTEEQIAEVEAAVKVLDVPSSSFAGGSMRLISLDRGSGAAVAEELQKLLKGLGKSAKIITPGEPGEPSKPSKPNKPGEPSKPSESEQSDGAPLFDPRDDKKDAPKEKKGREIILIPSGGHISVMTGDPAEQRLVEQLIDLITAKNGNEEFEVVKLKNTNAVEVARLLDDMYNGPRQPQHPQQQQPQLPFPPQPQPQPPPPPAGGYGGHHGGTSAASGSGGSSTGSYKSDRIRVLADQNLNAILLRAAPIDAITIKKLLREQIDLPPQQVLKNHVFKLKTANANDVANNIRELYRQVMDVNPLPGQPGGDRFGFQMAFGNPNAGRPVDVNGTPRPAALTIGVDERSNSLLIQSSEALFEEVKKLAADLDEAAKNPNRRVQVRFTRGLDPTLVQQVVDSIQGHRTTNPTGLSGGLGGRAVGAGFNRPFGGFGGGGPIGFSGGIGGFGAGVPGGGRLPGGGGLRPDDPARSQNSPGPGRE